MYYEAGNIEEIISKASQAPNYVPKILPSMNTTPTEPEQQ